MLCIADRSGLQVMPGSQEEQSVNPFDSEVFQFIISDAGPEGKFVLDLRMAAGQQKLGRRVVRSGSQTKQSHTSHVDKRRCGVGDLAEACGLSPERCVVF